MEYHITLKTGKDKDSFILLAIIYRKTDTQYYLYDIDSGIETPLESASFKEVLDKLVEYQEALQTVNNAGEGISLKAIL